MVSRWPLRTLARRARRCPHGARRPSGAPIDTTLDDAVLDDDAEHFDQRPRHRPGAHPPDDDRPDVAPYNPAQEVRASST